MESTLPHSAKHNPHCFDQSFVWILVEELRLRLWIDDEPAFR